MDVRSSQNLPSLFLARAAERAERPFLWSKSGAAWVPITWGEAARQVRQLAEGLRQLGIADGDRVALIAENRPEWMIADLAIMAAGAVSVPAYTSYTAEDYRHVLANSGVRAVIVSTVALARRVLPAANQVSSIETIILLEPISALQANADIHGWEDVLAAGAATIDAVDGRVAAIDPDATACLIYTSGTGGVPKGVMLSHTNILANCHGAGVLLTEYGLGDEVFLSFLPLTHAYEHTAGMMFPISLGAEIYFARGADTLAVDMLETRPTIMTAVPRLCETLHRRILQGVERTGGWRAKLFHRTLELGAKRHATPERVSLVDRLCDRLLDRLVRAKISARFGGRLKVFVSGGASLNPDVERFFVALGINLLQGYGQTEAGPVISVTPPSRIKLGMVGPALVGTELRIAEDGEILVRGPSVMKGYWNDPEASARTVRDGWLHTGDVGTLDVDGFLTITDRKRDFLKTTGGDMISPQRIEGFLTLEEEIAQAIALGDGKSYLAALIVPDEALLKRYPEDEAGLHKAVWAVVERVNKRLTGIERIRRVAVLREAFSVANGQMTPTLKIKRHMIRAAYAELIDTLYRTRDAA
ncbi:MAG TPA: long-chain fatty acid--CoA ligase [Stellaceae bacterium]|nr:long-chain fatty acid--CoA ligase [Stellaceae bacterium]